MTLKNFSQSSAFQGLGYPTIELKNPGDWKCKLGLKDDLSDLDIKKLNTLYMVSSFVQLFLLKEKKNDVNPRNDINITKNNEDFQNIDFLLYKI